MRGAHTKKMVCMVVTLDVSKLSGQLNADAPCRAEIRDNAGRGAGRDTGGREATAAQGACREGLDCRSGVGHGKERT